MIDVAPARWSPLGCLRHREVDFVASVLCAAREYLGASAGGSYGFLVCKETASDKLIDRYKFVVTN